MALVDYASSGEDDELEVAQTSITTDESPSIPNSKRKREDDAGGILDLPPLPSRFHDLYASTTRISTRDNPDLHGGRRRAVPHIEGNWPTHIYIEWYPSTTEYTSLEKLISTVKDGLPSGDDILKIHSFLTSDLGAPLPLHVSLSRPVGFATEQKDSFVNSLERAIKSSGIRPFNTAFSSLDWVANFENTRWFLVKRLEKPSSDGLNKLLHVSNTVVQEYGQPPLYTKPSPVTNHIGTSKGSSESSKSRHKRISPGTAPLNHNWSHMEDFTDAFHISIAWTLGAPNQELLDLTASAATDYLKDISQISIKISEIKAKVGNAVTNLPLRTNIVEGKSLFGF
ncbi:Uncharacterized protein BP5553_08542 [Venustampulla echinocandica]|uniref:U6 snRNA phosphodiesterase n=1 Tax=Venustampulla echinocandica TaxID=2656787 RepID=A0A370TEI4_9HELO|nr:Uncharacterized protein BP5553_08542 [Venustampulla echinocandica]RDL33103.1 Uncharacterized protein BP5553_08542 [Venustampulla echinocandica]